MIIKAIGGRVRGRRGSRLGIDEYYEVDKTCRLILVRRDGVEHLLMIGGERDLVIETGIRASEPLGSEEAAVPGLRVEPTRIIAEDTRENDHATTGRPPPRPAVFGDRSPVLRPVAREEPRLTGRNTDQDEIPR